MTQGDARDEVRDREVKVRNNDSISPRWDISQERAFIETLLGQRFNFFLVFFALISAGALNARGWPSWVQSAVLALGAIICGLLMLTIARAQLKLDLILAELAKDPAHPYRFINDKAGPGSKRRLIGYDIPFICTAALAVAAGLSIFGWLAPLPIPPPPTP